MKPLFVLAYAMLIVSSSFSQNKVLVIGIDGCRGDALEQANTPN